MNTPPENERLEPEHHPKLQWKIIEKPSTTTSMTLGSFHPKKVAIFRTQKTPLFFPGSNPSSGGFQLIGHVHSFHSQGINIFTYIYHKNISYINVGKYTVRPMDPSWGNVSILIHPSLLVSSGPRSYEDFVESPPTASVE